MQSEEYQWGRHHRALIAKHARSCPLNVHQLAERCGWVNVIAFQRHRKYWNKGLTHRRARIPIAYLNAIGVHWCELIQAVLRDGVEFDAALERMPPPESVIVHRRPCLGVTVRELLPDGLTPEERYSHIQRLIDTNALGGCKALVLDWPGMKQLWFHAHQEPNVHLWRPRVMAVRACVDFGEPRH